MNFIKTYLNRGLFWLVLACWGRQELGPGKLMYDLDLTLYSKVYNDEIMRD